MARKIEAIQGTAEPDWDLFADDGQGNPIDYSVGGSFTAYLRQKGIVTTAAGFSFTANPAPTLDTHDDADIASIVAARTTTALDGLDTGPAELIVVHSNGRDHIYDLLIDAGPTPVTTTTPSEGQSLFDPVTYGADPTGVLDASTSIQYLLDTYHRVWIGNNQTFLVDAGVFLDGTSSIKHYIIEGDGTGTIVIGTGCPTVSTFTFDATIKWGFHLNQLRASLSAGAVTYNDANRATGGGFPSAPYLYVNDIIIDGAATTGFAYGNTAALRMERSVVRGVKYGYSWRGYTDGASFADVDCQYIATGGWLVYQGSNGDNLRFETVKGLAEGIWKTGNACFGGTVIGCIQGGFEIVASKGITFVGCHSERSARNPWLKIDQSHVLVNGHYSISKPGNSGVIQISDSTSDATSPSDVTLVNWTATHKFASGDTDTIRSPDLYISAANNGTRVRAIGCAGATWRDGTAEFNQSGFLVASAVAGITTAIATARHLPSSELWELRQQNGTWFFGAPSPLAGLRSARTLAAPSYISQPGAATAAPGTLTAGTVVEYAMALKDADGNYTTPSAASTQFTTTSTASTIWQATIPTSPATLVVWRKDNGTVGQVLTAPGRYVEIPINGYRTKVTDTGANLNGIPWITTGVPVPNTVGAANGTWEHLTFGGIQVGAGTGTPEGVITAPVGSLFLRTDAATSLYVKQTGAGNTGWVVK